MKLISLLLTFLFLLSGCDGRPSFVELCESHSEICNEFTNDTWCRAERTKVGLANYDEKLQPSDEGKYKQLIAYEHYASCMDHASLIEHIQLKHKKTARINNAIKAKEQIRLISENTSDSNHPHLLYYHWSRYLSDVALSKFLKKEGTKVLENPESQFNLATYYSKRDQDKTLGLLFHALELYQAGDDVNVEIFKSISSIFAEKNENKLAYIWLKVLELYQPNDVAIKDNTLQNYIQFYKLDEKFLNKVANLTLDKIETGSFKAPKY